VRDIRRTAAALAVVIECSAWADIERLACRLGGVWLLDTVVVWGLVGRRGR
jgi:hypothetical protein